MFNSLQLATGGSSKATSDSPFFRSWKGIASNAEPKTESSFLRSWKGTSSEPLDPEFVLALRTLGEDKGKDLPVLIAALRTVHKSSLNDKLRPLIASHGGIGVLLDKLQSATLVVAVHAANCLMNLAANSRCRTQLGQDSRTIPAIMSRLEINPSSLRQIHNDALPLLYALLGTLQNLASLEPALVTVGEEARLAEARRAAICAGGVIPKLMAVIESPDTTPNMKRSAMWTMCNIMGSPTISSALGLQILEFASQVLLGDLPRPSSKFREIFSRPDADLQLVALYTIHALFRAPNAEFRSRIVANRKVLEAVARYDNEKSPTSRKAAQEISRSVNSITLSQPRLASAA